MANAIEFTIKGIDQFSDTFKEVGKSLKGVEGKVKSFENMSMSLGKTMTTGVTLPIAGMGAAILAVAGDFEKSMKRVQAVSGASAEQFEQLSQLAQEMGSTTRFSASESADAMTFLAQAGFDTTEIMGALPGVLQLAASAGVDLARSADIASNVLTGFGFEVEELSRVNDVLVKGMTSSNTNLEQLGQAMQEVGPIAASAGAEFELTVAALGKLSDAGIQGGKAGTSLRNALSRLLDPTKAVQETLNELGIEVTNAQGRLLPLDQIIQQLEPHAENTAAIIRIFGQEAGPGMAALASQGSESLVELADKLRNSTGEAARIAGQQSEGFNASLTSMRSALEGLAIAIANSGFLEFATKMVEKVTGIIRVMAGLPDPVLQAGTVIAATLGAGGPVLIAISVLSKAIRGLIAATGPIGLMITAATLLIEAWVLWGDEFTLMARDAANKVTAIFRNLRDKIVSFFNTIRDAPSRAMESLRDKAVNVFTDMGDRISGLTQSMTDKITGWWKGAEDELVGNSIIPDMNEAIVKNFTWLDETVKRVSRRTTTRLTTDAYTTSEAVQNAYRNMERGIGHVLGNVLRGSISFGEAMKEVFKDMVDEILDELAKLAANRIFGSLLNAVFPGAGSLIGGGGFLGGILGGIGDFFGGIFHGGMDYVPREGTYMLQRGERVLSPSQNQDLMRFIQSGAAGGGGGGGVTIGQADFHFFENVRDADAMLRMSREDWREIVARKMIPAMNDLDRSGVRPVSIERTGR